MDAKLQTAARNTIVEELVGSTDVKGWQAGEGGGNGASVGEHLSGHYYGLRSPALSTWLR